MAVIYVIKNEKNGKMYVGATTKTIEERWKSHCSDMKRKRCAGRKLYSDMNTYGTESFSIKELEETPNENRFEREKYWVEKLNTYRDGYNETLGGVGKAFLDSELRERVMESYRKNKNLTATCEEVGVDWYTARKALRESGIRIRTSNEINIERLSVKVDMLSQNGELEIAFCSLSSAAKYLIKKGYACGDIGGICQHIRDVCDGDRCKRRRRFSAYKHKWRYAEKKV